MKRFDDRAYQSEAIKRAVNAINQFLKHKNQGESDYNLLVMPCGSGKSVVIAKLTSYFPDLQILIITPRTRLLQQNARLIKECGILSGSLGNDSGEQHKIICSTYQTLLKRPHVTPDLVIVDEAHLLPEISSEYHQLLKSYQGAICLGLTATPVRENIAIYEHSGFSWEVIYEVKMTTLIKDGYLLPPRSIKIKAEKDSDKGKLLAVIDKRSELNKSHTVVFCRSVDHAIEVNTHLSELGEQTVFVSSRQNSKQNEANYRLFEQKEASWLVSCNMLITGVDIPIIDNILILRDFSQIGMFVQACGRGMRASPGKEDCAIFDFGNNSRRFGFIDEIDFKEQSEGTNKAAPSRVKHCLNCGTLLPVSAKTCSYCDYEFKQQLTLNDLSSAKHLLSVDIRRGTVEHIKQSTSGQVTTVTLTLTNKDRIKLFLKREMRENHVGATVIYRNSKHINSFIRFL